MRSADRLTSHLLGSLFVVGVLVGGPPAAVAQSSSASADASAADASADTVQPSDMPAKRSSNPGFMLGTPRGFVGVRGNWMFASAGSDLFDFVTTQLTLERRDFDTRTLSPELGFAVSQRLDLVFAFDYSNSTAGSEYRDFVDNKLEPINQSTSLRESNLTASVKFALLPKGRRLSRFAWIPSTMTPYVGAGGGAINYEFKQSGDFVDFGDSSVFTSTFRSSGWAPSAHAFGGVDVHVFQRLYLSAEARYVWAHATLGRDFVDFDPIDLGGFRVGAGAHFVF